jgi:hypothetical protein
VVRDPHHRHGHSPERYLRASGHIERILETMMKRITSVSLPVAALVLSDRSAVQGGIEFTWQGDATDLDGLAGTGLESIDDEGRRWSRPIIGGITVRF